MRYIFEIDTMDGKKYEFEAWARSCYQALKEFIIEKRTEHIVGITNIKVIRSYNRKYIRASK